MTPKPRIYRQSPGRWYVRTSLLPWDTGPFENHQRALSWAIRVGRLWM